MVELKTAEELQGMRAAGQVVARALEAVKTAAARGVTPRELDATAAKVIADAGATPAFLDYHPGWAPCPFPAVICVSVNDAVVHGIPGDEPLRVGDLVSVDCGAFLDGWCGDAAVSFTIGPPTEADAALIAATEAALARGIAAASVGNRIGDIGAAVAPRARQAGYGLLMHHGGHGIGRAMHEEPSVPNEGRRGQGFPLRAGMTIAIEPMLIAGGRDAYRKDPDGWTLRTVDGSRAAHAEHTIAVTETGPEVLTRL